MKVRFGCLILLLAEISGQPITAQQVTSPLSTALAAQASTVTVQDVTLSGSVESIAGSDDETVPFTFKAISSGSARIDVNLAAGTLTEIRQSSTAGNSGVWSLGGGANHAMLGHNLMTDAAWFFPLFIVQRLLTDQNAVVAVVGTSNGMMHIQAVEKAPPNLTATASTQVQHLSQIDLYLDTTSLLPVGLAYNMHPDNNALLDISVYIQFSNYQQTSGVNVPMHIQKFVNNTLTMDVQVQSVALNTGLTQANFAAQAVQ